MPRTNHLVLLSALAAVALVACGTDDSKGASGAQPAKTSSTKSEPAPSKPASSEPTPASASKPADAKPADSGTAKPAPDAAKPGVDTAIAAIREFIASKKIDKSAKNWKTSLPKPPKLTFDPAHKYYWLMNTTEGPIKIRLMPDVAPMHVSSTIYLNELGFYDGLSFHRVIQEFMAQGGDPLGTGGGNPGYSYAVEASPNAKHDKAGILSMANAGPGTEGSQFFLTFRATPQLNGGYTVFGEVVEGLDNLKKIEKLGVPPKSDGPPTKPIKIESAKIIVE